MQQSRRQPATSPGLFGLRRGALVMALLAVCILVGGYFIVNAARSHKSSTGKSTAGAHHTQKRHRAIWHQKTGPTLTPQQQQDATNIRDRKAYAASIVPVLDRSTHVFDAASHAVSTSTGNFDTLGRTCLYWGGKVYAAEAQYEGIPHPYLWWTPAGLLHHKTSGIYHDMLGALQNCQESAQATDSDLAAAAASQVTSTAVNLHDQENYARYLARH